MFPSRNEMKCFDSFRRIILIKSLMLDSVRWALAFVKPFHNGQLTDRSPTCALNIFGALVRTFSLIRRLIVFLYVFTEK